MIYTGYEILWLFFAGSFGGWCLETVRAAFKRKRFVNRGLVNGPFCVIYGIVLVALTLFYRELPLVRPEHELFEEFLLEVMGEGTCRVRAEDAFSATRTALAARLSQDTEQTVWIR